MQTLRQLKSRIKSVESVKKVTRAMEMISSAKVRPMRTRIGGAETYLLGVERIVNNLLASFDGSECPYLAGNHHKQAPKKTLVCVINSDTGMCGSYNYNLIRQAEKFIKELKTEVSLIPVGKKAFKYFKRNGYEIRNSYVDLRGRYSGEKADTIGTELVKAFTDKEAGEVYVVYSHFESAARFKPTVDKFLPFEPGKKGERLNYLIEPDIKHILKELIPIYIKGKMRVVLLNALVSEHSARVLAMGEATKNATDLLEALIIQRNKVRQAGITKEIIEVISSAEALNG
jgi:F-type H+-transporting ATPase subunit gamma